MLPFLAGATGPTIKAAGQITSAIIGNYRPTGVPRTGSREDRAAAYQRLLDGTTRTFTHHYMWRHVHQESGRAADKLLLGQMPQMMDSMAEMMSALHGVRLRGTIPVIAAAEALVDSVAELEMNEPDNEVFQARANAMVQVQRAFLDAARTDLAYDTKWWQISRRRSERKFLNTQQQPAALPRAREGD